MSLKLLLDEDCLDKILVAKLKKAGHDVLTAKSAKILRYADDAVLAYATTHNRVLLTRNCDDFCNEALKLKKLGKHHNGILLLYRKNDSAKDMSYDDIVRALNNVEQATVNDNLVLNDNEVSLSYYRY